jgi:hypothetical protein
MRNILVFIVVIVACAGCASVPINNAIPKGMCKKLIVRNINWNETSTSEITGEQMREFIASQAKLNELFQSEFDNYIKKLRVFYSVSYGESVPDPDTLIMIPKIYTLKPTGFMPGASFTGFLVSPDGKLIRTYSEERRLNDSRSDPELIKGNIEKLIRELAEDAASNFPCAR